MYLIIQLFIITFLVRMTNKTKVFMSTCKITGWNPILVWVRIKGTWSRELHLFLYSLSIIEMFVQAWENQDFTINIMIPSMYKLKQEGNSILCGYVECTNQESNFLMESFMCICAMETLVLWNSHAILTNLYITWQTWYVQQAACVNMLQCWFH
jgi:hypothetical protein